MRIHSDTLTAEDLHAATPRGVSLSECEPRGSRQRSRAWEVRLTGSSGYWQQGNTGHKAATYDEHGDWMRELFALDPDAIVGPYKGVEDFNRKTRNMFLVAS